ncbi:MAG TPA: porin family protein [Methylobacterium sp.]|nr:porin family protein [Methylobacterium sp.]
MKKLLTSFAAFTALTAAATAADLPRREAPPPIFTPVPVFTWSGFYAGFNAGYGFDASNNGNATVVNLPAASGLFRNAANTAFVPGQVAFSNGSSNDGFVGGGQIGYNYQFTPGSGLVVGIEADAQYVDFGRNRNRFAFATLPAGGFVTPGSLVFNPNGQASLDFFGTVRGRIGYAFDRVLFYGTGGFAYGAGGGRQFGLPNGSRDDFRTGWTAGGGVEYALPTDSFLNFFRSSAVTLKVEGLYVNLENNNRLNGAFAVLPNGNVLNTGLIGRRQDTEFAVVRAGLNYKFGTY